MFVTLTCYAPNAPELGHLLGKHPGSVFERAFSAGTVWVFYPEVAEDHLTLALVAEVDPVGLVRGPASLSSIDQYVNDRPYVASSLTSVALKVAFSTAMSGKTKQHEQRLSEKVRWVVALPAIACDAGESLIRRIFEPLGYAVTITRLPLDPHFPAWGQADLYSVQLEGAQTVQDVLSHLYVLLPVLDNSKHYSVGDDEIEKLVDHGGDWLASHPAREQITRRYLRFKRAFIESAMAQLVEEEAKEETSTEQAEEEDAGKDSRKEPEKKQSTPLLEAVKSLHEQRLNAVMAAVREVGARSLADLGCGEGKLVSMALKETSIARILALDVSSDALKLAHRRLHLDSMPAAQKARLQLVQGSLLYRDQRLEGFDVAALVEVIEHLDPPRLSAMERVVFEHARPRRVVITTPNREYNARWESLGQKLRHSDHRFEWTRAECQAWAERITARYPYRVRWQGLGPEDAELGTPSQVLIFDKA
jgi:3' terminal RNA ribose 2'-O-methyltransferase Hen1